jgi:hypothetical protein
MDQEDITLSKITQTCAEFLKISITEMKKKTGLVMSRECAEIGRCKSKDTKYSTCGKRKRSNVQHWDWS